MSTSESMLTEGLPIRRLGVVTHATATIWPTDSAPTPAERETRRIPIQLPAQIPMGGGWQLSYRCPTSGQEMTHNWAVDLFHDTRYLNSIVLHTYYLHNTDLLDSIASVFTRLQAHVQPSDGRYCYNVVQPARPLLGSGGSPNLLYYKSLQGGGEQFLLLYDNRYAPQERPDEEPSFVNIYELVQVELDENLFLRLLREAIAAGYQARP